MESPSAKCATVKTLHEKKHTTKSQGAKKIKQKPPIAKGQTPQKLIKTSGQKFCVQNSDGKNHFS